MFGLYSMFGYWAETGVSPFLVGEVLVAASVFFLSKLHLLGNVAECQLRRLSSLA